MTTTQLGSVLVPDAGDANLEAVGQIAASKGDANYGYWAHPETGWVTIHLVGANGMDNFYKGFRPLQRYGFFHTANGYGGWTPTHDPFRRIVEMGGYTEFPAEQIISLNWHRPPRNADHESHKLIWKQVRALMQSRGMTQNEALVAVFPQLADRIESLREWKCEFCPDRRFNEEVHLKRHESVMHQDDVRSRETRESMAIALEKGQAGTSQLMEMLAAVLGEVAKSSTETQQAVKALIDQQLSAPADRPAAAPRGRPRKA